MVRVRAIATIPGGVILDMRRSFLDPYKPYFIEADGFVVSKEGLLGSKSITRESTPLFLTQPSGFRYKNIRVYLDRFWESPDNIAEAVLPVLRTLDNSIRISNLLREYEKIDIFLLNRRAYPEILFTLDIFQKYVVDRYIPMINTGLAVVKKNYSARILMITKNILGDRLGFYDVYSHHLDKIPQKDISKVNLKLNEIYSIKDILYYYPPRQQLYLGLISNHFVEIRAGRYYERFITKDRLTNRMYGNIYQFIDPSMPLLVDVILTHEISHLIYDAIKNRADLQENINILQAIWEIFQYTAPDDRERRFKKVTEGHLLNAVAPYLGHPQDSDAELFASIFTSLYLYNYKSSLIHSLGVNTSKHHLFLSDLELGTLISKIDDMFFDHS